MMITFRDAFIQKLETTGKTIASVSRDAGVTSDKLHKIKQRENASTSVETAINIAKTFGMTVEEFMGLSETKESPTSSFPAIPRYDARLSAGQGAMNSEHAEILDYIPFTDEFLGEKLGRSTVEGLISCYAHGESMSPTIDDGDLLLIDTNIPYRGAGMYALNYGDESFVKRVEKVSMGYTLVSDNVAYPPMPIYGDEVNQLHIIGKIVWSGGTV